MSKMKLDIWSVVILIFIFHGVFLVSTLLLSSNRRKKRENIYLCSLIIILIWYLSEFWAIRNNINLGVDIFYGTRYGSWFLLGPLTFCYFRSITDKLWTFSKYSIVHFIPFVIFVLIIPLFYHEILNKNQIDYGMLSVLYYKKKNITPVQSLYSCLYTMQFLHLGGYLIYNLILVKRYRLGLTSEYSRIDVKVKWLKTFNMVLLMILLFSSIFIYFLLVADTYTREFDYVYVLPTGILFYLIGFYLMDVKWKYPDENVRKYAKSSFNIENVPLYKAKLERLMKEKKVYCNNEIRLADLANLMDLNTHHLSQLINQEYKLSFFDFINSFRIEEAKKLIIKNPEYTLLQIAFESGFNNKTSFVNAFKKFEKITPSKYRSGTKS